MNSRPQKKQQLDELLESGRRMKDCAEAGDWESVDDLQRQCEQLSKQLFSNPPGTREAAAYAAVIGELLEINQCIGDLGRNAREICLDSVGSLKRSRRAISEYTANTE